MNWTLSAAILCLVALSYGLTIWIERYALKKGILDNPNARSSHKIPTPRGGGTAIVLSFAASLVILLCLGTGLPQNAAIALLGGSLMIAAIGWIDDRKSVSAKVRLLVHALASIWFLAWLGADFHLALGPGLILPPPLSWIFGLLFLIWMTNLYNFMDGINGLAGGQCLTVAIAASALCLLNGALPLAITYLALAASSAGFLFRNWDPAKIFMGDVGSGFLGFGFGALALLGARTGELPWISAIILMGAFVVDATYTLSRRLLRGERVHEAHRDHAYQKAVSSDLSHRTVATVFVAINLLWLAPWAAYAIYQPSLQWYALIAASLPLLAACVRLKAGIRTG